MKPNYKTLSIDLSFGIFLYILFSSWFSIVQSKLEIIANRISSVQNVDYLQQNLINILDFKSSSFILTLVFFGLIFFGYVYSRWWIWNILERKIGLKKFFMLSFRWLPVQIFLLLSYLIVVIVTNAIIRYFVSSITFNAVVYYSVTGIVYLLFLIPLLLYILNFTSIVYIKQSIKDAFDVLVKKKFYKKYVFASIVLFILINAVNLFIEYQFYNIMSVLTLMVFFNWQKIYVKEIINH